MIVTVVENRPEVFALMLSCQKICATFVPLAVDLTHKDCHTAVNNYSPKLIVCDQQQFLPFNAGHDEYPTLLLPAFRMGDNMLKAMMHSGTDKPLDCRANPQGISLIFSTSGSTGRPKGVVYSNAAVAEWTKQGNLFGLMQCTPGEKMLCWVHVRGGGTFFTLMQFLLGITEVVVDTYPNGPAEWATLLDKYQIENHLMFGAAMDRMQRELPHRQFTAVKNVIYGGSCFAPSLVQSSMEQFPNANFTQGYGMTETMMISFLGPEFHKRRGEATEQDMVRMGSAGCPIDPGAIFIEDLARPFSYEAPPGEAGIGLICFKPGSSGFSGYYNDPEKTREVWDGISMRTGDVGRIDENGFVHILGRSKDIIPSYKGFNVSPRDIEETLYQVSCVGEAAVVGIYHPSGAGEAVVAYVSAKVGCRLRAEELWQHCAENMASWQLPDAIHVTEMALPKKDKIDRVAIQGAPFRQALLAAELQWASEQLCAGGVGKHKAMDEQERDVVQTLFEAMLSSAKGELFLSKDQLLKVFGSSAEAADQALTCPAHHTSGTSIAVTDLLRLLEVMDKHERDSFVLDANSLLKAPLRIPNS